ncbi:GAF domain-containing protein [Robertmurraya sp. Marseille-Q9965]
MFEKTKHYAYIMDICVTTLHDVNCDFVGFAFQNQSGPDIKWHVVAGNQNEKYKHITLRYGKGIAGRVISTGSSMTIEDFPNDILGKALEYPIMLAEKLIYAYAVPIHLNGVPKGVFLTGQRVRKGLSDAEKKVIVKQARSIEDTISE